MCEQVTKINISWWPLLLRIDNNFCSVCIEWFILSVFAESYTVGNISIHVTGQQGENATLACNIEDRDIFHVILTSLGRNIPVCEMKNCSGRFFKKGSCDIFIKDLHLSDAGKYILRVFYNNDQTEVERQIRTYQLHIHGKVKTDQSISFPLVIVLVSETLNVTRTA